MKTSLMVLVICSAAAFNLTAQTNTPFSIIQRDANSRVWQRTNWVQDASGQWTAQVHRVTELGSGICHKVGSNYVDSSEAIALLPDGTAAATNCATSVYFPSDIGTGVIRLVTSDGQVLQNGPAYLAYAEGTNAVIIASVTNSVGRLVRSNQVLYPDIFHGAGFRADLVGTVRKSGYENDIVFREQIPSPETVGLSTNACVELLSEWFEASEPSQTTNAPSPTDGLADVTLHFGAATIGQGRAFMIGTTNVSDSVRGGTRIYKRWLHSNGGQAFLVEAIPYQRLVSQLKQLPASASVAVSTKPRRYDLSTAQNLPSRPRFRASTNTIQVASADLGRERGLVADYIEVSGTYDNHPFPAGTYFVNGPVYCTGNTTINAGAIFKYPFVSNPNYYNPPGVLVIEGPLTLNTTAANKAIFTAADDDSVGQSMNGIWPGYTGTIQSSECYYLDQIFSEAVSAPAYADPAIELTDNPVDGTLNLKNLRFTYATTAIGIPGGYSTISLNNLEVESCGIGFRYGDDMGWYDDSNDDGSRSILATNCLVANVNAPNQLKGSWSFANCTMDEYAVFNSLGNPPFIFGGGSFYNSILFDVPGDYSGGNNAVCVDSSNEGMSGFENDQVWGSPPFQTGPAGDHYVAANSPFVDAGTTTADILGFFHFTTRVDQVIEGNSRVDLGYHYVALNSLGNPIDTDGDGIPDYLEDVNGNGDGTDDPSSWFVNDGLVAGHGLQVFTPLK